MEDIYYSRTGHPTTTKHQKACDDTTKSASTVVISISLIHHCPDGYFIIYINITVVIIIIINSHAVVIVFVSLTGHM